MTMPTDGITVRERNVMIEWSDVRDTFISGAEDGKRCGQREIDRLLLSLNKNPYGKNGWSGGSGAETLNWLRNGYRSREFNHSAAYVPLAKRKRASWSEDEGDADIGRLYGGWDDFYLHSAEQEKKPGIRLLIEFVFAARVEARTIRDYGAWIAGFIASLETSGYDLTVDIFCPVRSQYIDDSFEMITNTLLRVKRENEVSDFTNWSVLFSPTGFRHVMFTAFAVAANKAGKQLSYGLGSALPGRSWDITYDPESSTVKISVDQLSRGSAPIETLNKRAHELRLIQGDNNEV